MEKTREPIVSPNGVNRALSHGDELLLPPPLPERPLRAPAERPYFYTARELALILRVTENTIYRLARRGELPSFTIGRSIRFRTADVEAWLERTRMAS